MSGDRIVIREWSLGSNLKVIAWRKRGEDEVYLSLMDGENELISRKKALESTFLGEVLQVLTQKGVSDLELFAKITQELKEVPEKVDFDWRELPLLDVTTLLREGEVGKRYAVEGYVTLISSIKDWYCKCTYINEDKSEDVRVVEFSPLKRPKIREGKYRLHKCEAKSVRLIQLSTFSSNMAIDSVLCVLEVSKEDPLLPLGQLRVIGRLAQVEGRGGSVEKILFIEKIIGVEDKVILSEEDRETIIKEMQQRIAFRRARDYILHYFNIKPATPVAHELGEAILQSFTGAGKEIRLPTTPIRGFPFILVIADYGKIKSTLLRKTEQLVRDLKLPVARANLENATIPGILASAHNDKHIGWHIVPGPLPRADNGVFLADNYLRMDKKQRHQLIADLEGGEGSWHRADKTGGQLGRFKIKVSLIATDNPSTPERRFDPTYSLSKQIDMEYDEIDRFDNIVLIESEDMVVSDSNAEKLTPQEYQWLLKAVTIARELYDKTHIPLDIIKRVEVWVAQHLNELKLELGEKKLEVQVPFKPSELRLRNRIYRWLVFHATWHGRTEVNEEDFEYAIRKAGRFLDFVKLFAGAKQYERREAKVMLIANAIAEYVKKEGRVDVVDLYANKLRDILAEYGYIGLHVYSWWVNLSDSTRMNRRAEIDEILAKEYNVKEIRDDIEGTEYYYYENEDHSQQRDSPPQGVPDKREAEQGV